MRSCKIWVIVIAVPGENEVQSYFEGFATKSYFVGFSQHLTEMTMELVYSIFGANIVRARADIVATKLGIILSSFSFSFHVLFSQKGFA